MKGRRAILTGLRREGARADDFLARAGLVLTQGGEPTFVTENTLSPEWNLEALGPDKLTHAWALCRRLSETLMPDAFILQSNGKHYPGEPIPRWKLTLITPPGGKPLWKNSSLLLRGGSASGHPVDPRKFLAVLCTELGLPRRLQPAYEDIEAAMRLEAASGAPIPIPRYSRRAKGFVQPRWSNRERARWKALHQPVGWVLPLSREEQEWVGARWSLPGGEIQLLPGSSAVGLRLPLLLLPPDTLQTAVTAEIRNGALLVFLPPLPDAESFSQLVAAVERTAAELSSPPISIEGYAPAEEPGWESLSVIPDPGVIEVNLPPARDWKSLERTVTRLFAAAGDCGLKGTRMLPSGETAPTGGGAHLVLGGAAPDQNPFLLRPSLLPSFLRFLQNHPSLSYLFNGRFIGPSSQAPRVDEGFFEIPYELETALQAIETMPSPADPAMIDMILRNLLLDYHGNTHKAEVSVDKFFNPFMPNGRLGLVEFRAIEMSPDPASFLAVHALWRAMAAAFTIKPYRRPLVDWGIELHDRFLLPAFLQHDLGEVLAFLSRHGFAFDTGWFTPQFDLRFPILSEKEFPGGRWILRRAAEPWPLLGEQPSPAGGVVRCVDSSTERLELHLRGLPGSAEVRVNGHLLRLRPHPTGGLVGAFRHRTMLLPTCLHPHSPPDLPVLISLHAGKDLCKAWHYDPTPSLRRGRSLHVTPADKVAPQIGVKTPHGVFKTLDLRANPRRESIG